MIKGGRSAFDRTCRRAQDDRRDLERRHLSVLLHRQAQFETGPGQLPSHEQIEIIWRIFQRQPDTQPDPSRNAVQNLAEKRLDP
ncbi:MAG: hypothetical protein IPF84_10820 [Proteobacteria bacterium]|nr:hypothetical protein [Pseudomonadota bacterium]